MADRATTYNETEPRHGCRNYFAEKCIKSPELVEKDDFDALMDAEKFSDGPFKESFGDGYGEPYNPHRQAFGMLKDGRGVYTNLWRKKEGD